MIIESKYDMLLHNLLPATDSILSGLVLILSGIFIRTALISADQYWAKGFNQTITFLILPFVTFVITKVISGSIALSLGMIGAMSIVRFRNPVKSPLELVMYFALITIGIAANVRFKWSIYLTLTVIAVIVLTKIIQKFYNKYNKNFYTASFNEGTDMHLIEINSSKKIDILENNKNLKVFMHNHDQNEYIYKLAFISKDELTKLKTEIEGNKDIIRTNVNFV